MTDITVIILIGQEKIHLKRCVEKLAPLNPRQIFLVESQPDDGGVAIAKETAAKLGLRLESKFNKWPGNQAAQFNWALDALCASDKCKVTSDKRAEWILRLDADEYLTEELTEEIKHKLPTMSADVDGVIFKRRHYFAGGWAKHGTYPVRILRLFRKGKGRYAPNQVMDERIEVPRKVVEFENDFIDHSLISMDEWRTKHHNYAKREAKQFLAGEFHDPRKVAYYKLPRYLRAVMYFCIRYFLKGGFLDGVAGWRWNFWQGLWYRWLVDVEIGRLRSRSASRT